MSYSRLGHSHKCSPFVFRALSLDLSTVNWNTSSNVEWISEWMNSRLIWTYSIGCSALKSALLLVFFLSQKFQVLHKHFIPAPFLVWLPRGRLTQAAGTRLMICSRLLSSRVKDRDSWLPDRHLLCARSCAKDVEINDSSYLHRLSFLIRQYRRKQVQGLYNGSWCESLYTLGEQT